MANKRLLKKNIRRVCGDLAAEIVYAASVNENFSTEKVCNIVKKIAELQVTALDMVTFSFDKSASEFDNRHEYNKARKAYNKKAYRNLCNKFDAAVQTIVKAMNDARPK